MAHTPYIQISVNISICSHLFECSQSVPFGLHCDTITKPLENVPKRFPFNCIVFLRLLFGNNCCNSFIEDLGSVS